jgi:cation:H+ antiporter
VRFSHETAWQAVLLASGGHRGITTAPAAALRGLFSVWSTAGSGKFTAATSSVMGDHAVTMTIAFLPLALVGLPVGYFRLLWVNLSFVALMPALFALFVHFGHRQHGFKLWQALTLDAVYLCFVGVVVFWVLGITAQSR